MPHYIVFTGHMIDNKDRKSPRFPASRSVAAGEAIRATLQKIQAATKDRSLQGIAAAACGGDILFHEACRDLQIPSELYLAIPIEAFNQSSVAFAGPDWEKRYRALTRSLPVHILHPEATAHAPNTIWEEANRWMLDTALAAGGRDMTLIALWDGGKGDTGGTSHMIDVAKTQHATIDIIDSTKLPSFPYYAG